MAKLRWIRDCWSLFISNLSLVTTTKDLFDVFKEAGPVFDVFLPKDKITGKGRGFGFVRFKTEWDANRPATLNEAVDGIKLVGLEYNV
ncbi:hypothetical protein AAC387_Pa07g1616 [Persea americana]